MDLGLKLGSFASLDSGVSVSAGASANGTAKDIGSGTLKPARCRARFALSQTGTTNKASLETRVQYSSDNTNWPDDTEGDLVFSWDANALGLSAGADLTRSNPVVFVPKERYYRFRFRNYNGTDSFSMSSEVAEDYVTDT